MWLTRSVVGRRVWTGGLALILAAAAIVALHSILVILFIALAVLLAIILAGDLCTVLLTTDCNCNPVYIHEQCNLMPC